MSIQGSINHAINTIGGIKSIARVVSEQTKMRMSSEKAREEASKRFREAERLEEKFKQQFNAVYSPSAIPIERYESAVKDAKEQGAKEAMAKMAKSGMERYNILYGGMDDGNTKTT